MSISEGPEHKAGGQWWGGGRIFSDEVKYQDGVTTRGIVYYDNKISKAAMSLFSIDIELGPDKIYQVNRSSAIQFCGLNKDATTDQIKSAVIQHYKQLQKLEQKRPVEVVASQTAKGGISEAHFHKLVTIIQKKAFEIAELEVTIKSLEQAIKPEDREALTKCTKQLSAIKGQMSSINGTQAEQMETEITDIKTKLEEIKKKTEAEKTTIPTGDEPMKKAPVGGKGPKFVPRHPVVKKLSPQELEKKIAELEKAIKASEIEKKELEATIQSLSSTEDKDKIKELEEKIADLEKTQETSVSSKKGFEQEKVEFEKKKAEFGQKYKTLTDLITRKDQELRGLNKNRTLANMITAYDSAFNAHEEAKKKVSTQESAVASEETKIKYIRDRLANEAPLIFTTTKYVDKQPVQETETVTPEQARKNKLLKGSKDNLNKMKLSLKYVNETLARTTKEFEAANKKTVAINVEKDSKDSNAPVSYETKNLHAEEAKNYITQTENALRVARKNKEALLAEAKNHGIILEAGKGTATASELPKPEAESVEAPTEPKDAKGNLLQALKAQTGGAVTKDTIGDYEIDPSWKEEKTSS
ncbi:MAG: hypothetical protein JSR46_00615 [Verrucomicrobia bacterium]|nr:hypothetical protein [Verrucomicrobiota bacterium]